jgi:PAS domain S-box-containing protein
MSMDSPRTERQSISSSPAEQIDLNGGKGSPLPFSPALMGMHGILASFPEALVVVDKEWRVAYSNAVAARLARRTPDELLGNTPWDQWPASVRAEVERQHRRALKEGTPVELPHPAAEGPEGSLEMRTFSCELGIVAYYRDITGQKGRELSDFIENAAAALNWVADDGTILWANDAELKLLGYSREEYVGQNIAKFHVDGPVVLDILERLKRNEELHEYESRVLLKDGTIRYVSISSRVYREEGRFIHTRCVTLDITEQKRVSELQERLAAIVESSDDAILSKDLNGIIRSWNRGAERIFGYKAEEIVGKHISTLAAPERVDELPNILDRIRLGERIDHYETKRKTKDGRILNISLTVSPIRDGSGVIVGASKVARDITDQRNASELQERLAAIVESSDDAIISKDLNGIIQSWNHGAERIFGYRAEEIVGKHISTLATAESVAEIPNILQRISRGEHIEHYETTRKTKDGRVLNVSLTVSPIRDASGAIIGASKVGRDITERRRQEEALREANEALMQSNADLQHFAYSASHDLQEPLRMVATYSEMLKRKFGDKLGPSGDEYIGYAIQGALRMEQLLKDLRSYTQASTGGQEPTEDIDAGSILDKALANLDTAIKDSGAGISHTALPAVRMHQFQLEQLFQNLIGNAIRYRGSDAPRIHVAAERQRGNWLFSVQDNGIGIDPQYKEQVFGIFKRLHSAAEYPGTGMGLAICQRIVQRSGGRIWVESELGRGSTFFFTIPCREK